MNNKSKLLLLIIISGVFLLNFNNKSNNVYADKKSRFKTLQNEFVVHPQTSQRYGELFVLKDTETNIKYLIVESRVGMGITKLEE